MANENVTSSGGLRDKAADVIGRVSDRAGEQLDTRLSDGKNRAADTLSGVADSLRTSSQQIRDNGQEDMSRYIERAAQQVDRVANYLQSADVREMAGQVEDFARRQPAAFMAGAFALGFVASRVIKSSRGMGYTDDRGRSMIDETRRSSGSSAGFGSTENFVGSRREFTGDPSVRTSVGLDTGEDTRSGDIVGDPSVRTSVGLDTNSDTNRGV